MRTIAILSFAAIAMAFEAPPPVPNQVGAILGIYAMCGNDPIDCGDGWCCLSGQQCVTDPTGHIMCYDPGLSQQNNEPITVDPAYFGTSYSYQATPSRAFNYPSQTAGSGTTILIAASGASSAASAASVASQAAGGGSTTYAASSSEQTVYGSNGGKPSNSTSGATNVSSSGAIVMSNNGVSTTTSSNLQVSIVALIGFFGTVMVYL